ncbi:MAG: DNA-binding protein [Gammaproteobacteria bacterium]|nr:DNA-binding protein [Gammaproteobacteria bacterium]
MPLGRPVVGVMGSGSARHTHLAEPLGRALARIGVHLLTGGGAGVMESVSRAFSAVPEREGLVIGILPAGDARPDRADADPGTPPGYPNRWVELAIRTHLDARGDDGSGIRSRNHINILSSDVVIALPGSSGTASEVDLTIRYRRPLILLGDTARADRLPGSVPTAESVDEAVEFVRRALRGSGGESLPQGSER